MRKPITDRIAKLKQPRYDHFYGIDPIKARRGFARRDAGWVAWFAVVAVVSTYGAYFLFGQSARVFIVIVGSVYVVTAFAVVGMSGGVPKDAD